jgi:N-acetylglucosaminyldiphosphoundecaprenol N-acetyl-beta-D-mannosaminyltransferase
MVGRLLVPTARVIDFPITALKFDEQVQTILGWAIARESKAVCVANVHMLMKAYWNPEFASILKNADLVTPDGMPLVWMMRRMGAKYQDRVAGLDILQSSCESAQSLGVSVYFMGSQGDILSKMRKRLEREFPRLKIVAMEPLPFRPLTEAEDEALVKRINTSGAGLVFVSLGCPKQENWIANHKDKINSVMVGLGGAFPVYAGIQKRAPKIVRDLGMEWLYRFIQEPRRLWGRYATTIPAFVWLAFKQLLTNNTLVELSHSRSQN